MGSRGYARTNKKPLNSPQSSKGSRTYPPVRSLMENRADAHRSPIILQQFHASTKGVTKVSDATGPSHIRALVETRLISHSGSLGSRKSSNRSSYL